MSPSKLDTLRADLAKTDRELDRLRKRVDAARDRRKRLQRAIEIEEWRDRIGAQVTMPWVHPSSRWSCLNGQIGTLIEVKRIRAYVDFGPAIAEALKSESGVVNIPAHKLRLDDDPHAAMADSISAELNGCGAR